jgi:hypothetical protein
VATLGDLFIRSDAASTLVEVIVFADEDDELFDVLLGTCVAVAPDFGERGLGGASLSALARRGRTSVDRNW